MRLSGQWTTVAAAVVNNSCSLLSPALQEMDLHHVLPQIRVSDFGDVTLSDHPPSSYVNDDDDVDKGYIAGRGSINDRVDNLLSAMEVAQEVDCLSCQEDRSGPSANILSVALPQRGLGAGTASKTSPSPHSEQWWDGRYDFAAKVIVLGDYGVGKSTLLATLGAVRDLSWCRCLAFRPNEYVEMECRRNDKKVLIRIVDTGGQERFRSMTSSYFRGAHGCLLMFNVTMEDSFNNIMNWFNDLGIYTQTDNVCALIVGATTSVYPTASASTITPTEVVGRTVSAERAFRLAESLNLTYCETNVRDTQTVLWVLTRLVNSVIVSRARRHSLAISIMPPFRSQLSAAGEEEASPGGKKRRWNCCGTS